MSVSVDCRVGPDLLDGGPPDGVYRQQSSGGKELLTIVFLSPKVRYPERYPDSNIGVLSRGPQEVSFTGFSLVLPSVSRKVVNQNF